MARGLRSTVIALATLASLALTACGKKPSLGTPQIGSRAERQAGLVPAKDGPLRNVRYLGCDVRFESLPDGTEIKIEWRLKGAGGDWKTSRRETVNGTGNGTLRADLATDANLIDTGTWECNFHAFVKGGVPTGDVDVSARVDVVRDIEDDD